MAFNDHTDWRWDERVLQTLASTATGRSRARVSSSPIAWRASAATRIVLVTALAQVEAGRRAWVDAHDRDSLQLVWIQFHEDLLATLGIPRGSDT